MAVRERKKGSNESKLVLPTRTANVRPNIRIRETTRVNTVDGRASLGNSFVSERIA